MLKRINGYTLIEILIVISIFSALFVAGYSGFRDFSRREQVNTALLDLTANVKSAQQQALAGDKPFGCTGNLKGYSVDVRSTTSYVIVANCDTNIDIKTVSLPTGITVTAPVPNPMFFKTVGDGTNIPPGSTATLTITQSVTNNTRHLYVSSSGELREDTGLARASLTPTPTTFYATPTPTPLPTPTPSPTPQQAYTGQYFNNRTLTGTPALTREDANISFNWGTGSPGAPIGVDNFSVRWTRIISFAAGSYTFSTTTDDGVRLYVDGTIVIDQWRDQGPTTYQAVRTMTAGNHTVVMEFYENGGGAYAVFSYQQGVVTPTPAPTTPPGFNFCTNEGGYCDFPGTGWRVVRYGVEGRYIESGFPDGVACNNSVFGDPAPGVPKHCDWFN